MKFREFQQYRETILASNPGVIDLAETNLWRSLASLIPQLDAEATDHVHRCDLAKHWTKSLGLSLGFASQAMISAGVRDSLSILLPWFAQRNMRVFIPADVYPVYGELAETAGLAFETFPTVPEFLLPKDGDCLLLPNPLKPTGRWLRARETEALRQWLAVDAGRRLLLDAVYTFDVRFHEFTLALLQTGQAALLHSLSKGWLHPQVFGVALVPQQDLAEVAPLFRDRSPAQENLSKARQLFEQQPHLPRVVGEELDVRRTALLQWLPAAVRARLISEDTNRAGYLLTLRYGHQALLHEYHILSIPLCVFGGISDEFSVLSTLGNISDVKA